MVRRDRQGALPQYMTKRGVPLKVDRTKMTRPQTFALGGPELGLLRTW